MKTNYTKLRTKVLGIIDGMTIMDSSYNILYKAIHEIEQIHNNLRKDGSPEFSHQIEMLAFALNYHHLLLKPLDVYLAILTHDTLEDYPETITQVKDIFKGTEIDVVGYSNKLSKIGKTPNHYFDSLSQCEVCSVVKLIDRIHNLSTAPNVFSTEKILKYCDEVETYFLPVLYRNAKVIHNQRQVYELLKSTLVIQCSTIRNIIISLTKKEEEIEKPTILYENPFI